MERRLNYKHLGRQTQRLEAFGYITTEPSQTDKRRKIYSVLYGEAEIVTCDGDNPGADATEGANFSPLAKKVTTGDDNRPEKVTKPKSQPVDPQPKPAPKRLSKTYLRDPAKPCASGARNGAADAPYARQGDRGGGNSRAQGHMLLPLQGGYQKPETKSREPDWRGWAAWLQQYHGMTSRAAWQWLSNEQDRLADERGIDRLAALAILDRELKRQRKAVAA